jgi:hypothetical protein
MTEYEAACEVCDEMRKPVELLEVVAVRSGDRFFICRPGTNNGRCFRTLGPRAVHRVTSAGPNR